MRWGLVEREEHYTYGLAGGGPLHSSGTVGERLSGANKGLQIGGCPRSWGQWWDRGGEVVGVKASSRYDPSPLAYSNSIVGGGGAEGAPFLFSSSPSLAIHHSSSGLSQPGHAHDGPIPEGSPIHLRTPANKESGHWSPPAVPTPGPRGRASSLQPLFPAR